MKMISAIIRPEKLEELNTSVTELGVSGITATEVKGFGRQKGHTETYRGSEYEVQFVPKVQVEIAVDDAQADAVQQAIITCAKTNKTGDGKIFYRSLTDAIRIRTGDTGANAI